jgi:hypothetical protein
VVQERAAPFARVGKERHDHAWEKEVAARVPPAKGSASSLASVERGRGKRVVHLKSGGGAGAGDCPARLATRPRDSVPLCVSPPRSRPTPTSSSTSHDRLPPHPRPQLCRYVIFPLWLCSSSPSFLCSSPRHSHALLLPVLLCSALLSLLCSAPFSYLLFYMFSLIVVMDSSQVTSFLLQLL